MISGNNSKKNLYVLREIFVYFVVKTATRYGYAFLMCLVIFATCITTARAQIQSQSPFQNFDDRIMIDIQNTRTPQQTEVALALTNSYKVGCIGVPAALLIGGVLGHNEGMRQNSLFVASSTAVSWGFEYLIKHVVNRRRPFVQNTNIIPVYRAGSTSFPSGHAAATFSTATALSMAYPKWYVIAPAFLWAGSVSYSRMYLGVHYPTDVAAGTVLGVSSALSMSFIKK